MPVEIRYYLLLPLILLFSVYVVRNNPLVSLLFLILFTGINQYFMPTYELIEGSVGLM
jgi:glucan phosphoethanolaminetransferase (alkaline phosphatase superfamily)